MIVNQYTLSKSTQLTIWVFLLSLPVDISSAAGKIAYLAHRDTFWQVWTMQPDGTLPQQITRSPYDKSHISWYPDGIHLLVNGSQGELSKVNTLSQVETPIRLPVKGTVDAVISPNGQYIAFSLSVAGSIDNNHIWLVKADGTGLQKLTNMKGLQHEPVWALDGKALYFLSKESEQAHNIWRIDLDNRKTEQLTAASLYSFDLALARDTTLAFSNNRTGNYEIWVKKRDGKAVQITHHEAIDARPSWSPDGRALVFDSARDGVMNIWMKPIGEGKAIPLTKEKVGARFPVWYAGGPGQ